MKKFIDIEKLTLFYEKLTTIFAKASHKHSPSDINQDSNNRFVTDQEKNNWNSKANSSHTHTKSQITDFPDSLKNPYKLTLTLGSGTYIYNYDGSSSKDVTINPSNIGAQPAGNYANAKHTHSNNDISSIDASKITTGTIDIARLPAAALERLVEVINDDARFKLTKEEVQIGDTVKVTETMKMYRVINDNKLSTEDGYTMYVAGRAAEVPWSGVTDKPSTFTPSTHTHTKSQISDFPSSLKNPYSLSIQLNGGVANVYDGSSAKSLNITPTSIGAQVAGSYASSSHNHNGVYAPVSHGTHVTFGTSVPKAPGNASAGTSGNVSREDHVHPLQTSVSGNAGTATKLATARTITLTGHVTGSVGFDGSNNVSLATTVTNNSHTHLWANITDKPNSFTPSSHNQSSNTITAMTGYTKASAVTAIAVSDSLNVAIGKLEKALDGKQASGSYALSSHTHSNYLATTGGTISGSLSITGDLNATGNVSAYSDITLKRNIVKIDNALNKINQISGYTFDMVTDNKRHAGVIAQEIQKVLPEVVSEDEYGLLSVSYGNIVALLIESIKELNSEVKGLKKELRNREE